MNLWHSKNPVELTKIYMRSYFLKGGNKVRDKWEEVLNEEIMKFVLEA